MKGQLGPQDMIEAMVSVIGSDDGNYRNVWPPSIEDFVKQVQEAEWSRPVRSQRVGMTGVCVDPIDKRPAFALTPSLLGI